MDLCRRKADGAMFRASFPDDYDAGKALADCFSGVTKFYFRGVIWKPRRWWQFKGHWLDTGEIWEPESGEFEVLSRRAAEIAEERTGGKR